MRRGFLGAITERIVPRINRKRYDEEAFADTSGACGITAIQNQRGATREVFDLLLQSLCDNDIRGGSIRPQNLIPWKSDIPTGDGAGIMLRTDNDQIGRGMQEYLHKRVGRKVPMRSEKEQLHGAHFFIDSGQGANLPFIGQRVRELLAESGVTPLSWKPANVNPEAVSQRARQIMPHIFELIYAQGQVPRENLREALFKARLHMIRELSGVHAVSLQPGTMTIKGMCRGHDLPKLYPDLLDALLITDAGLVHRRFGTNVLAHWLLAQPFDFLAHNGENNADPVLVQSMANLERMLRLPATFIMKGGSDTANCDRALQLIKIKGKLSLSEAVRIMMPPASDDLERRPQVQRDYFEAAERSYGDFQEVGPIALLGMDESSMTVDLDNNGLRPLCGVETSDGLTIIGSELGIPHIAERRLAHYFRLAAGEHRHMPRFGKLASGSESDREVIQSTRLAFHKLATQEILDIPRALDQIERDALDAIPKIDSATRVQRAHLFGLNAERLSDLKDTIDAGKDPVEGMGSDLAIPPFSQEPHSLGRYIRCNYAQVTNPSLSTTQRKLFQLKTRLGRKPKIVDFENQIFEARTQYALDSPLIDDEIMENLYAHGSTQRPGVLPISTRFSANDSFIEVVERIKQRVLNAARTHARSIIVLNDRECDGSGDRYVPPHLIVSYLTKSLIEEGLNDNISLVVDSGEVWDQHEYATLIAAGAAAVHPRMIYELIDAQMLGKGDPTEMKKRLAEAFNFTLLRYMAKVGINNINQYRKGRHFSTLGLDTSLVQMYIGKIPTNGGGVGIERILDDQGRRAAKGNGKLRPGDEKHAYAKEVWKALQEVGESEHGTPEAAYKAYTEAVAANGPFIFSDILRFRTNHGLKPIPIGQVESIDEIIKKLEGADISFGAVNDDSHRAIQLLFRKYGSVAGSGEGALPPDRYIGQPWEAAFSRVIQSASGRFGQEAKLLADPRVVEIQIKIGQGAKPGVGGHLPGEKVFPLIAEVRGVGIGQDLISPPTNHNIYSIEDLEAFIGHLRALNPAARIGVKITSGANVGNIAVGCAKAGAQTIRVSGDQGGTGAATFTDKFYTGLPRDIGTVEAHRTMLARGVREGVKLGVDGGIRTGRDVVMSIIQGADSVALGTAILIAQLKCVFCKSCHNQRCPSDICRSRGDFLGSKKGKNRISYPESEKMDRLIEAGSHFLELMAGEIREIMAQLGVRKLEDLRGQYDLLEVDPQYSELAAQFDLTNFLEPPEPVFSPPIRIPSGIEQRFRVARKRAESFVRRAQEKIKARLYDPSTLEFYLRNPAVNRANKIIIEEVAAQVDGNHARVNLDVSPQDRSVGATLSGLLVKGILKLPPGGIHITTRGNAGQGYGFGLINGITMDHFGGLQNEVCEIQSGGTLIVRPHPDSPLRQRNDLPLVGNTLAYGSRGGDRFIEASVGDRACIRESGGRTVISGNTGKLFGNYKTGGRDTVLGTLGYEVGLEMSGGIIYTRDTNAASKLSNWVSIPVILRERDRKLICEDLKTFYRATGDREVQKMLSDWEKHAHSFQKIVANSSYQTAVFQYLYSAIEKNNGATITLGTLPPPEALLADLCERCGVNIDKLSKRTAVVALAEMLKKDAKAGQKEMSEQLSQKELEEPEQRFIFLLRYAGRLTEKIVREFRTC